MRGLPPNCIATSETKWRGSAPPPHECGGSHPTAEPLLKPNGALALLPRMNAGGLPPNCRATSKTKWRFSAPSLHECGGSHRTAESHRSKWRQGAESRVRARHAVPLLKNRGHLPHGSAITSCESRRFLLVGFFVFDVALGVGVDGVLVGVG